MRRRRGEDGGRRTWRERVGRSGKVPEVTETTLPGVGVRHDFVTKAGDRIGMITHRTGRRELLVFDDEDPDRCQASLPLDDDDSHALADMLGAAHVTEHVTELKQTVEGMTIEWLHVEAGGPADGATLADLELTGGHDIVAVALVRHGEVVPAPERGARLDAGDTVVLVGANEALERALARLGRV